MEPLCQLYFIEQFSQLSPPDWLRTLVTTVLQTVPKRMKVNKLGIMSKEKMEFVKQNMMQNKKLLHVEIALKEFDVNEAKKVMIDLENERIMIAQKIDALDVVELYSQEFRKPGITEKKGGISEFLKENQKKIEFLSKVKDDKLKLKEREQEIVHELRIATETVDEEEQVLKKLIGKQIISDKPLKIPKNISTKSINSIEESPTLEETEKNTVNIKDSIEDSPKRQQQICLKRIIMSPDTQGLAYKKTVNIPKHLSLKGLEKVPKKMNDTRKIQSNNINLTLSHYKSQELLNRKNQERLAIIENKAQYAEMIHSLLHPTIEKVKRAEKLDNKLIRYSPVHKFMDRDVQSLSYVKSLSPTNFFIKDRLC